jgi:hypothetical protein
VQANVITNLCGSKKPALCAVYDRRRPTPMVVSLAVRQGGRKQRECLR